MTTIKDVANQVSKELLKGSTPPEPDPFDIEKYPCGVLAGDNKFESSTCPTCGKPATHPSPEEYPWTSAIPKQGFFMFRDECSTVEYKISGMCQACQDSVFGDS